MMITVQEAHNLINHSVTVLGMEELPLGQLQGRVLAREVKAPFSLPRFTNSAMDGFALRWSDISTASKESPVRLQITEKIPAGTLSTLPVTPGCCAEIMTGAPMPDGADTVLAFEESSGFGQEFVEIYKAPKKGANVRYSGEEVALDEVVLQKGVTLSPSEIAVLASFGFASAPVHKQPRVAIVTVGDEVRSPGEELSGAEIYNCNRFLLESACRSIGIEPVMVRHAPDERALLREVLALALGESDLLITAGGISSGEYDFVQEELSALGVTKKFWKIAQKPGKPLYFGSTDEGKAVFALPGNPVSALVCFVEYCLPALSALAGKPAPVKFRAALAEPFTSDKKRHRFLLGSVWAEEGQLLCKASPKVESHMITAVVGSNCLIEAEPSEEPLARGSKLLCTMLPWSNR